MDRRIPLAAVGAVGMLVPRRLHRAIVCLVSPDADGIEIRGVTAWLTRLAGAAVLGWVIWRGRSHLGTYRPDRFDVEELGTAEPVSDPVLTPGTRRHDIASVLYHAEDPLAASDVVELSSETDWEMGRSTASATLYRMYNDDLVARQERSDDGSYEYWLTPTAERILEADDGPVEPDPFVA